MIDWLNNLPEDQEACNNYKEIVRPGHISTDICSHCGHWEEEHGKAKR